MLIPVWYAICYPIALIVFVIIILLSSKKCPDFSVLKKTISYLGGKHYNFHRIFNLSVSVMGLFNIPLVYFLFLNLPKNIMTFLGIFLLSIGCFGMIIIGILGYERAAHDIIATITFSGYVLGSVLLIYPFILSHRIPKWTIFFSFLNLTASFFILNSLRYKSPEKWDFKKPLSQNFPLWEWISFFAILLWIIIVFVILFLS